MVFTAVKYYIWIYILEGPDKNRHCIEILQILCS